MPHSEFTTTRRIEFADTDMAGIMHFSNFFRFAESCEHAFYRHLGCPIHVANDQPGWPRVHASFDFHRPLRFGDEVSIHLVVCEVRSRSIRYAFRILDPDGQLAAVGRLSVVCVRLQDGKMTAVHLPKSLADQLRPAPLERLAELQLSEPSA